MKQKTLITLVIIIFIVPVFIGLFIGCNASPESSKTPPQKTQDQPAPQPDIAAEESSHEINYPGNWKEISQRRQTALPQETGFAASIVSPHPTPVTGYVESNNDTTVDYFTTYEWRGQDSDGMAGGMRGYGNYGQTPTLGETPVMGKPFRTAGATYAYWRDSGNTALPPELMTISADEVWVIIQPEQPTQAAEEQPGCGAMMVNFPEETENVPLPLKHTDVKGEIAGYIASVDVTQQFHNPYDEKIEAVYVFPLPQNAAIHDFIMTIGDRKIRGIIRKRQEAEQIYEQARAQGHVASLLTQERPNIFTQKVANIEPGKNIDVNIRYYNTLAYVDGWYEFVFPMVIGPRFNPPHTTDGIGAVAHDAAGKSGQQTEVQYLKPNQRSGHDISLSLDIHAGTDIEDIACVTHVITEHSQNPNSASVALSDLDSIPNKDFVLRYKVAGDAIKSAFMTHTDKNGNYFTMMLYPPQELEHLQRAPMEMIFVLDCSGSMSGVPMEIAKGAIKRALKKLRPDDTFQIIRFSSDASQLGAEPVIATKANIEKGLAYVDSLNGSGGTMMIEGIKAALDFAHDPDRLRLVSFMTDGYIGNEAEILGAIYEKLGTARIFSFGVGSSVNRFLLDRMAKLGKGAVAYIGLNDSAADIIDLFYDRISHPALTDITIDWGTLDVADVYPSHIPDLFAGRPVILTGRFTGQPGRGITVHGNVAGVDQQINIPISRDASSHEGLAAVWARKKIEELANQSTYDNNPDLPGSIEQIALEYGLMSAYTAFVAVDSSQVTQGDHGISIAVPVPTPEGVRYDTTVIE